MKERSTEKYKEYTIKQILDYMECPLCYHLKYVKRLPPSKDALIDDKNILYQECIQESIRYYYLEHQQGKPPTLKEMYNKFYSLWMDKTGTRDRNTIFTRSIEDSGKHGREERSRYITKGYETIQKFYGENAKKKQAVLAVNHPYTIQLDQSAVVGEFDLIREVMNPKTKRREIEIVNFQTTTRKPDESILQTDLSLTGMAFAFEQMFQTTPDRFIVDFINRKEQVELHHYATDYKRMFSIIQGFILSVDNPPYPRPGAHRVHSPYKLYCDQFTF